MAAVNRRSRVLEGECLECLVECFEKAYASEPQRYKNTACTACFGPLMAPVAVVERATWVVNDIVKKCREPSLEAWDRPGAKVTRYPHIPTWAFDQREYVQYKFQQSVLEELEIYMD
eukprot:jgi/Tetstr1/448029/TSEL_035330.t1